MIFSIFSPSAGAVKPRRHSRILRADITAPEIDPALRAFGRHIARSHRKAQASAPDLILLEQTHLLF